MRAILVAAGVALAVSILLTPYLMRLFARRGFGQEISADSPAARQAERDTPTLGGVAILVGIWVGFMVAHLTSAKISWPSVSGWLVLLLATALGLVGFLDDYINLRRRRNRGLTKTSKLLAPLVTVVTFAVLALKFANSTGVTPASVRLSFVHDILMFSFGAAGFVVFCYLLVSAWSNAVNLSDGLDGLAVGGSVMVLASYVIIGFWQSRHVCESVLRHPGCYVVRDPLDLALLAAAAMGACIGFLWWNSAPAGIVMGDTGSLALGGLMAGLSIVTRTELLLVILGGVFVIEALSVVLQIVVFRTTRRRLFRMAPFHHHFELASWAETTVIVRFWVLAAICCAIGLGIFTTEWLNAGAEV